MVRVKARSLARFHDHYGSVDVYEFNGYRSLCFTGEPELTQGSMRSDSELGFRAEYLRQHIAASLAAPRLLRVLCLGLGIGALPRLLRSIAPGVEVDAVERQPAVFAAANEYFGLRLDAQFRVHFSRAETFVRRRDRHGQYDLIFVDCYNGKGIAPRCGNIEFYENVNACLNDDGFIITNLIRGRPGAREAIGAVLSVMTSPWALPAQKRSNCTVFGRIGRPVSIGQMRQGAERIDRDHCLPFLLYPEVQRIEPAHLVLSGG